MAHDPVNHPKHYTSHPSGIECIQITRWLNFNAGNAVKYVWRAGEKNDLIEDLKKAAWYLNDEIERIRLVPFNSQLIANVRPVNALPDNWVYDLLMGFTALGQAGRAGIIFDILAAYEFGKVPYEFRVKLEFLNRALTRLKQLIAVEKTEKASYEKQVNMAASPAEEEDTYDDEAIKGKFVIVEEVEEPFTIGDLYAVIHELAAEAGLKQFYFDVTDTGEHRFKVISK